MWTHSLKNIYYIDVGKMTKNVLLCFIVCSAQLCSMSLSDDNIIELNITTQWNSTIIDHDPVKIILSWNTGDDFLTAEFSGPFFHDPEAPAGEPGQPFPELWEYEVAEIFFLAPNNQYLEVEVSPYGQHLLIMLNGTRNPIKDMLPMIYEANITRTSMIWKGIAQIPLSYLPHGVAKINAFAIHGTGKKRVYEALYPVPEGKFDTPDFHRLEYFKNFKIEDIVKNTSTIGTYWDKETPAS